MAVDCRSPAALVHHLLLALLLLASDFDSLTASLTSGPKLERQTSVGSVNVPSDPSSLSLPLTSRWTPISARRTVLPVAPLPSPANYSFPDASGTGSAAHLMNAYSSITGPNGRHMHLEEGDVAVPDKEYPLSNEISQHSSQGEKMGKYAIREDYRIWPKGRIPYVIDSSLWEGRAVILRAMKHIMDKTCVTFVPRRKKDRNFIRLYQGAHRSCFSMIGRVGGSQGISLGSGCLVHGVVVHELMHAIGFFHMHSRSDRDRYVKILWPNIDEGMQSQFRRNAKNQDILFRPFDYRSIMLYGPKLFSRNGQDTMVPLKRGARMLDTGVKKGLSDDDARSINMLYSCPDPDYGRYSSTPPPPPPTTSTTTTTTTTTPAPTTVPTTLSPVENEFWPAKPTQRRRRRKYKPRRKWNRYWDKLKT